MYPLLENAEEYSCVYIIIHFMYIRGNTNNRKTALFPFQNNLQIAWAGEKFSSNIFYSYNYLNVSFLVRYQIAVL
jgi:hypothetical protein